jgi:hypothetical protein
MAGLSAVIYTQLTDIETVCNGLLTYDREVNKVIPEHAAAANTCKFKKHLLNYKKIKKMRL